MTHPMSEPWVNWRPIETAPLGDWVLVWAPGSNVRDACLTSLGGKPRWLEGPGEWLRIEPTHWAPLPAPPPHF